MEERLELDFMKKELRDEALLCLKKYSIFKKQSTMFNFANLLIENCTLLIEYYFFKNIFVQKAILHFLSNGSYQIMFQ